MYIKEVYCTSFLCGKRFIKTCTSIMLLFKHKVNMKLNKRRKKLINILLENYGILSGAFLASKLDVTSRTIRNDIKYINELSKLIGCQIDSIVGRGYSLVIFDKNLFEKTLSSNDKSYTFIDKRLNDETTLIIKNTLSINNYTFQQITDLLHISDST